MLFPRLVWERGGARKLGLDPVKFMELHYSAAVDYRILLVGVQGTAELRHGYGMDNPYACYPVWEYGTHTIPQLEALLRTQKIPVGNVPSEVGRTGQEHRVVITRPPDASTTHGKAFLSAIKELQFEYPSAIIHLHGLYSYRGMFGSNAAAADIEPTSFSSKGKIVLPNGKVMFWEKAIDFQQWLNVVGWKYNDLAVARNRTMFNIDSAVWAGQHFNESIPFRVRSDGRDVDPHAIVATVPTVLKKTYTNLPGAQVGDKFLCDICSLAPKCKLYRDGGVCTMPNAETEGLARYFKTRDSDQIIDGLARLMEKQLDRVERAMAVEEPEEELDPQVSKILKDLFDQGVKLAKLVDPTLNKPGVFIDARHQAIVGGTAQELVSNIIAELESQGIDRRDIDEHMVATYIANSNREAINVTSSVTPP